MFAASPGHFELNEALAWVNRVTGSATWNISFDGLRERCYESHSLYSTLCAGHVP